MKLRKYDYFKLADEDFKRVSDTENIYRILEICEDVCVEARNVATEMKRVFRAETIERATKLTLAEIIKEKSTDKSTKADNVDMINKPPHYTRGMECIDEMILIFGVEAVKNFCKLNVWKYRKRALYKNGEQDMEKSDWYINKLKELESME